MAHQGPGRPKGSGKKLPPKPKIVTLESGEKADLNKITKPVRLAGRKKGSTNVVSREIKEMIESFLSDNREQFEEDFLTIRDPEKRCKIFLEAAKIIMPKPKEEGADEEADRRHRELLERIWPVPRAE